MVENLNITYGEVELVERNYDTWVRLINIHDRTNDKRHKDTIHYMERRYRRNFSHEELDKIFAHYHLKKIVGFFFDNYIQIKLGDPLYTESVTSQTAHKVSTERLTFGQYFKKELEKEDTRAFLIHYYQNIMYPGGFELEGFDQRTEEWYNDLKCFPI